MSEFRLRQAMLQDESTIKDLIHRVNINPMGLHWERFLVAETGAGQFVGCAQIKHHQDGSLELASLAVEEAYRGRGVASSLIRSLLQDSPRPLYLMCRPELGVFYQKFGFRDAADPELPAYFRRIRALINIFMIFGRDHGKPRIMRLDAKSA
jgi:N-acetylglutamate synthase-like GNAT family acetyltransferase